MFEDIAQMEKEIETFRKNILASTELVEGISKLIEETKNQKEGLSASTASIIKELESAITQFKTDHGDALRELIKNNKSLVRQLQEIIADEQRQSLSEISKIQQEMDELKKSVIMKFSFIMCGIGITLIVNILILLLR